jgi:23S rRNA pseudouridine1911/1915/1917 synthase
MKSCDKEPSLDVVYMDNHLFIVEKSENLLTQPSPLENRSLENLAKEWLRKETGKNPFLHCIHRLDKEVSGLVIFARSSKALSRLNEQMREKKIKKIYVAWVEGKIQEKEGQLIHFLRKDSFCATVKTAEDKEAKEAKLFFRVLEVFPDTTLVEITLETGRYHQIRAQFAAIGHPIVGDCKYGAKKNRRVFLHQKEIEFMHPVTKEKLHFVSKKELVL